MQKSKSDIWVGLFVLLGFLALAFMALQSANLLSLNFQKTYTLIAKFDNIGGLKPQAAVRSAGVLVGRVESIALDNNTFQARVHLALQSQYTFPKDSSLKVLTSGLLGEQYIGIEPGGEEAIWVDGNTTTQTQSAVVLENLIGQVLFNKAQDGPVTPSSSTGK